MSYLHPQRFVEAPCGLALRTGDPGAVSAVMEKMR